MFISTWSGSVPPEDLPLRIRKLGQVVLRAGGMRFMCRNTEHHGVSPPVDPLLLRPNSDTAR